MAVTKGPPISGKLGQYGPKGVTKPVNTGYGPPVKKAQLPNVFDIGNKLEARELHKLQKWAATGSASGKAALRDYEGKIERSLQKRAEDNGYINFDVREYIPKWINHWIFGEDDQALIPNWNDKDKYGKPVNPQKEVPGGNYPNNPGYPGSGGWMPRIPTT